MSQLPSPDAVAAAHSERLRAVIAQTIRAAGGWIPFARYMELALYAPGLGYYAAGAAKLGAGGDFVTAPEISPLFGQTLARPMAHVLDAVGGGVLELGAGSGRLARDLLRGLDAQGSCPAQYLILEVSPDLRARQQATLADAGLRERVQWIDRLPERFSGVVVANEVFDALPVHVIEWRDDGVVERGVALDGDAFAWAARPVADAGLAAAAVAIDVPRPYRSEISLAGPALMKSLGETLAQGAVLVIDYGFPAREYYHPQRSQGTLMCHYRHRAHGDPFLHPGLADITAHVDFSALADAAHGAGLDILGYTSQAGFLIDCGITGLLAATPAEQAGRYLPLAAGVQKLVSPAEMGEIFKVLGLGRGMPRPLPGFRQGDRTASLG
ncbi:MAG: class I SAM-dependent methyltransferase [Pseudomonadota bacterium]